MTEPNIQHLAAELLRRTPSAWAQEVRYIKRRETGELAPYSFEGRPYLLEAHDCQQNTLVVQKGSQTGFTEMANNRALHCLLALSDNVLTVLPQREQIRTFVQARVDPMFAESPPLRRVPLRTSNPEHKRIATSNWYFRGSNSPDTVVEFAVRMVILDELDRLNPETPGLALERMAGIREDLRRTIKLSTPTFAGRGIDSAYRSSTRSRWVVPCCHCHQFQALEWGPEANLAPAEDADSLASAAWRCRLCGDAWTEQQRHAAIAGGHWEDENPDHPVRGLHVSQLYSPAESALSIVTKHADAHNSDDAPRLMRVFMNSVLGLPWSVEGEQITDAQIDRARDAEPFTMRADRTPGALVSAGADIGRNRIHVSVAEWGAESRAASSRISRCAAFYVVSDWEDLDSILLRHGVSCFVVDALPETRNARAFQERFPDIVWLAYYPEGLKGELVKWHTWKVAETAGPMGLAGGRVDINRTEAFDRLFARFQAPPTIRFPGDQGPPVSEVREHLKALIAVKTMNRWGQEIRRWDNAERADHFAHAMLYAEIAGLQVGELSPGEVPEERGAARVLEPEFLTVDGSATEFDAFGGALTGVY